LPAFLYTDSQVDGCINQIGHILEMSFPSGILDSKGAGLDTIVQSTLKLNF